jgi:hypothetical protein
MCPDKQFLSIYYDGELPEIWGKKMEQHIEACPECENRLGIYRKTSGMLNTAVSEGGDERHIAVMEAAKDRVWQKLGGENIEHRFIRPGFAPHIPTAFVAAAAGAAAAVMVIAISLFVAPEQNGLGGLAALNTPADGLMNVAVSNKYELNIPEIEPVSNMQELLHYLENDYSSNIVVIKLPERKKFNRYGEPALINAANYPGRGSKN